METVKQSTKRKSSLNKNWFLLLFFTFTIFHLDVRAQQIFTCTFSNPDGPIVYPCASVVTATINMPITNNPIQQIQLIFPNSFEIGNVNVPFTYNVNPIPGGLYAGITYSNTDLLGTFITVPTANSTIVVTLFYRSCDVHPTINTTPLNINHLFFDCKGFSGGPNNITYNATLVQANPGLQVIGGAAIANYGLTNAPNAIEVVGTPTIFLGSSNNNTYQAVNQEIFIRYFDVIVNPTSLQEFNVHITDELDVEELELFYVSNSGPVLIQPALLDNTGNAVGFGNYSFTF